MSSSFSLRAQRLKNCKSITLHSLPIPNPPSRRRCLYFQPNKPGPFWFAGMTSNVQQYMSYYQKLHHLQSHDIMNVQFILNGLRKGSQYQHTYCPPCLSMNRQLKICSSSRFNHKICSKCVRVYLYPRENSENLWKYL